MPADHEINPGLLRWTQKVQRDDAHADKCIRGARHWLLELRRIVLARHKRALANAAANVDGAWSSAEELLSTIKQAIAEVHDCSTEFARQFAADLPDPPEDLDKFLVEFDKTVPAEEMP